MKSVLVGIVVLVLFFASIIGVAWLFQGNDFFLYRFFAPRYEQVRRETFEQSKSYNQGMIQELENMHYQYIQADDEHKKALSFIILHRVADYNQDNLPSDLRTFINDLRSKNAYTH